MKLERFQPTIKYLEEPLIEVGKSILLPEPKMGWALCGPRRDIDAEFKINLGIIGDLESVENTENLIERLKVVTSGKDKKFLHIGFPGLDKLNIKFNTASTKIQHKDLATLDKTENLHQRIKISAELIIEKIKAMIDRHPSPDLLIVAYPKKIDEYCIKGAIGKKAIPKKTSLEKFIERQRAKHTPLDTFLGTEPSRHEYKSIGLRSVIKVACMEYDVPIQIIRPHTTSPYDKTHPTREDDATAFWNLVVAMFYKSNHIPWHVKGLMEDTCYLGVSFFKDRNNSGGIKTALAQVFSLNSEGVVFKGEEAAVDDTCAPHISFQNAAKLTQQAIDVFKRNTDCLPKRIVVHKTSRFNEAEKKGFAVGSENIDYDLVAFGTRDIKLIRWGTNPPIRGTMVRLPDRSVLLYTSGYIPYLGVYPGLRVPSPLEILEHHGESQINTICKEILSLTKLNWNSAKFCTKAPITIGFARKVGEIMREAPPDINLKIVGTKFKFYM